MDPACGEEHVEDLLSRVGIPVANRGTEFARSPLSVEQILERIGGDALILGPHVNGPKGILTEHDGRQRLAVLKALRLAAVEVDPEREIDDSWLDGSKPEVGRRISQVWSSDAHGFEELGQRFTWVKMTQPNIEGLGLALLDGADSLKPVQSSDPGDPNIQHGGLLIESITVTDARYMGRRKPMTVRFNPWLNAMIGGRGTGKSTLVDFCRKTLRRDGELGDRTRGEAQGEEGSLRKLFDRRVPDAPTPGREGLLTAATRIEVIYRKQTERFKLSWSPSGEGPSINRLTADGATPEEGAVSERFPVRIYSQKQLFALAQNPDALLRTTRRLEDAVLGAVGDAQRELEQIMTGENVQRWRQVLDASEERFQEATAQLVERGIRDPSQYRDLVAEAARLQREIEGLAHQRSRARELEREANRTLEKYRKRRVDLGDARRRFAASAAREDIRVEVVPFKNHRGLAGGLMEALATERFEADRKALGDRIRPGAGEPWTWEGLDGLLADIRRFQAGNSASWPYQDWRFEEVLKNVPPDSIDRLAAYAPGDTVWVEFRDPQKGWRRLSQGSPGQQTAALLAFVLGHGEEPIILDQPEDDLDNTLIYDLLVTRLKEAKLKRQMIVVTHNPNIVVHGDAEFVLSLETGNGESRKACEGGLQERKVRDEICRVMEGGREAFRSRYRRVLPLEARTT